MIKLFKILVFIILLLLLAIAAFVFTFDANNYKAEIIEQVEQQTGREFDIAGDIGLSVFPWIGLKVEDVSLGNAAGFSSAPMVKLTQLDVKVMVLPLLKKEVQVDKVRLHGLSASLETNAQGVTNWADLAKPAETQPETQAQKKTETGKDEPAVEGGLPLAGLVVNGIEFVDANISWIDARSDMKATVSKLSLETGSIGFDKPVDVEFKARVENNQPELDANIELTVQLQFNEALNKFSARQLSLEVQTLMQSLSKETINLQVKTDAVADLEKQSVKLSNTTISALGATINAGFDITRLDTTPEIKGSISSNSINAKALAKKLQIELPPMANAKSLEHVSLSSKVNATPSSVVLDEFKLELDTSTLTGWVRVPDLVQPTVRYNLTLDAIKLDDYMPPVAEKAETEAVQAGGGNVVVATGASRIPPDIDIPLPVELLKKIDIDGQFEINKIDVMDIAITAFSMKTIAGKGVVSIKPVSMKLLDGEFTTGIRLDVNQPLPAYTITANAKDIHAGPVINPVLAGFMTKEEVTLEGSAHLSANIETQGSSVNVLKQAANGKIDFDMNETSLSGLDIEYFSRNVVVDYLNEKKLDVPSEWRGEYKPKQETAFNKIHATALLAKGKITNNDFIMDSKHIDVTGQGVVDIMINTMDYNAVIDLTPSRKKTFAEQVLDEPIGVHIHGPFELLAIEPDKKRMAKAVSNLLEQKLKAEADKKLNAEKERLKAKADAEKKAVQEKLEREKEAQRQKLEREKEEQKQKMEDKLKNKLKGLF